jgi:hypothetical protein
MRRRAVGPITLGAPYTVRHVPPPRHFTLEQANAALAEVRPLAERMVAHRREVATLLSRRAELTSTIAGNGGDLDPGELSRVEAEIAEEAKGVAQCVNRIHGLGAQVKDADDGLVDFPALREGEEILLCWKLGEHEIAFWHGLEDGFAGRQPVEDL